MLDPNDTTTKWTLTHSALRIYPDGALRAVTGRPIARVTLLGVECEVRRASYADLAIIDERLGFKLADKSFKDLTAIDIVLIASLAVSPIDASDHLPPDPRAWPYCDHYLVVQVAGLFSGQGALVVTSALPT